MRLTRLLFLPILVGSLAAGCGDDDDGPTGPNVSQFQGTWNATAITYTSPTNAALTFNAFAAPTNGRLSMIIAANGSFTGTFTIPPNPPIPMTGTITLQGTNQGVIDFTWPAGVGEPISDFTATYALQGNQLSFTRTGTTFPAPHPAAGQPATLVIAMTRT
jgi:hypothetical protein